MFAKNLSMQEKSTKPIAKKQNWFQLNPAKAMDFQEIS